MNAGVGRRINRMADKLTEDQAFHAMFAFLEAHYRRTRSDELGALLGALSSLPDGQPADAAVKADWSAAVAAALSGKVDPKLRLGK